MKTKALEICNLTKTFKDFKLDNVSFTLPVGFIMGLVGENGAGKTTTIKLIFDLLEKENGVVKVFGNDTKNGHNYKQDIAVVFDDLFFVEDWKISDIEKAVSPFYSKWDTKSFHTYLNKFNISMNKKIKELSKGMKMKLNLAVALSHQARLLILDEPTSGLDPVARDELLELFHSLVQEGTRSILFSTHITSDLDKCADDITYIQSGKILLSAEKNQFIKAFQNLRTKEDKAELSLEEIMLRSERRNRHDEIII